ncbi:sporulation histidine kinase inhibitor Sda [Alkalihalobacillus sp. BA299]|nr:sporulation histidine kinase inhibitor Sda [Alkalihalobacillus sp. BA299]
MLVKLSYDDLLEAYNKAIACNLPKDFIQLLEHELERREATETSETK